MFHSNIVLSFFEYLAGFLIGLVVSVFLMKIKPDWNLAENSRPPINTNVIVITNDNDTIVDRYMYHISKRRFEFFFSGGVEKVMKWQEMPE